MHRLMLSFVPIVFLAGIAQAEHITVNSKYGGKLTVDPQQFRLYDVPRELFEPLTGMPWSIQAPEPSLGQKSVRAPQATGRVLAILVEWENHPANSFFHPQQTYDSLFFSDDVYPVGSVNDYYQEVSYGNFNVTGDVVGWVLMSSFYSGWYDINEIINAVDPVVDFGDYDGDGDGYVDALWLIHAGPGQEETHDLNDIWSHAYSGVYEPTNDGVAINRWSMCPEEHMGGAIITSRVFCHEYGHILGMPDLYDYDHKLDTVTYFTPNDWNDHPLVDWDVMGYAGYNIMSYGNRSCPSHFCAWSRIFLGFANAVVPECLQGAYDLYNIEEYGTQNIYKVPINESGTEYFLLEYRNPRSSAKFDHLNSDFSAYCPWFTPGRDTLDQGLLITHIDENVPPNDGWPSDSHYAVTVVDAGYKSSQPWNGQEFTEWWYPYEFRIGALYSTDDPGQTTLSTLTDPSSAGYNGPTGIVIIVIAQNSDFIRVIIDKPIAPVLDPIAPIQVVAGDSIGVWVHATDPNCTTPGLSPAAMLPPYAHLWDSSGGRGALFLEPEFSDIGIDTAAIMATDGGDDDTIWVQITVTAPPCLCNCHADPAGCNGAVDIVDVSETINVAFRGSPAIPDPSPSCPRQTTDVDCSGSTDIVDVTLMIDVAFRGAPASTKLCNPCGP